MNTNYNLRKALYTYLDVKFDSATQTSIANNAKFKIAKVGNGSIVNIFVSAEQLDFAGNSIYLNALSVTTLNVGNVNEYYSDFKIKVY
jgi:hypothetical protein